MRYFDSACIAKCYLPEPGHEAVVAAASQAGQIASSLLARGEVAAVFHRKLREGSLTRAEHREVVAQFRQDCRDGIWHFLPVSPEIMQAVDDAFAALPASVFIRTADCVHLVTAREGGFKEIHSNDRHLLAAAGHFRLKGIDPTLGR
jgi:predicted nucleic acid-binding protein